MPLPIFQQRRRSRMDTVREWAFIILPAYVIVVALLYGTGQLIFN